MKRKRTPETGHVTPTGTQSTDLDQLIEERKEEKRKTLKEKLEQKLKIIRDQRVSGVNIESFPEGAFGRLKNNNVWEEVCIYFKETSDVLNALYVCRTFAEILEERRILVGLGNALNVFKTKVDEAYEVQEWDIADSYQNWNKICLSARSVCKAWKETVDLHCDISRDDWFPPLTLTEIEQTRRGHGLRTKMFTFNVVDEESVVEATSLINEGFTISPIRDLSVLVDESDSSSGEYYRNLMEFLEAHGTSVRFLHFGCGIPVINPAVACERLGDILGRIEKLKEFELVFYNPVGIEEPEPERAYQDIQAVLNERPLPVLESVIHFSCSGGETEQLLISQILKKCINLKSLDLFFNGRLQEVLIEALMGLTLERFIGHATTITSFRANWPLKYLEIMYGSGLNLNASILVPAVNRFRETLEHLQIMPEVEMDVRSSRLELPHLKSFCISAIRGRTLGFDELLPLKSLEKIIVGSLKHEDENALVKVKRYFESEEDEMHKSNVWQCFPNLMWLHIPFDGNCYRRSSSP